MIRRSLFTLLVIACLVVGARQAHARGSSDNPVGPTVSPYLNLLNNNSSGVTNYQSLVRPLIQQDNAISRQGNQLNRLQQQVSAQRSAASGYTGSSTGHVTLFMNYSHYYQAPAPR